MTPERAKEIALFEMRKWGLLSGDSPWTFRFNSRKRALGLCNYQRRSIHLSTYFLDKVSETEVLDTIRHEIAHALAGPGTNHGPLWRAACIKVGAKPERTYKGPANHQYRYALKWGDRVVARYMRLPPNFAAKLPHLMAKGVPESKGKLKLFRLTYPGEKR